MYLIEFEPSLILSQLNTPIPSKPSSASIPQAQKYIADVCKEAISEFIKRMEFTFTTRAHDGELENLVNDTIQSWDIGGYVQPRHVATALAGTMTAYGHISSIETRLQIVLFTALVLAMDDPATLEAISSNEFHKRICAGAIQGQPGFLGKFTMVLGNMWDHYPVFSANTIYASALRFINASLLENECECMPLATPHGNSFIEYKRSMSATTEAYACFIWDKNRFPDVKVYVQAIPDVMLYVSYANDILSFYKEELAGETGNYVHERAAATGKSSLDTLRDIIKDTIAAVARVRSILGEGDARDAFENFAAGYMRVHAKDPRYLLQQILENEYIS